MNLTKKPKEIICLEGRISVASAATAGAVALTERVALANQSVEADLLNGDYSDRHEARAALARAQGIVAVRVAEQVVLEEMLRAVAEQPVGTLVAPELTAIS